MTIRLPRPGGDDGDWGNILNDFLDISHNSDGTLNSTAVSNALPSPIPATKLGSGTPSSTNFLRGDGAWAVPSGGGVSSVDGMTGTVTGLLQSSDNLSDVTDAGTSRANLHVPDLTPAAACGDDIGGKYTAPSGNTGASFSPFSGYVDGYYANVGDMILLVNEAVNNGTGSTATAATNGLWQVQTSGSNGTWVRPAEFASGITIKGRNVTVMGGNTNSGMWYLQAPTAGVVIDSSSQTWQQIKAGQSQFVGSGPVQFSTSYIPGDVLMYKGGYILVTNSFTTGSGTTGSFPFVSSANYIDLSSAGGAVYMASDYGVVGDGTTDNGAKLNALIQAVSANGGGNIHLPPGTVCTSTTIILYTAVHLWGNGFNISELRLLANSNCDVVQFFKSPDGSTSNAFFCGLWNIEINGNRNNQSPTDFHMGVNLTTNPVSSGATHDVDFDPTHILCNVSIKGVTGHGWYAVNARNGMRLIGVYIINVGGHGYYSGTDTEYSMCHVEGAGLAGFYIGHSSAKGAANKSYNNGTAAVWTSGNNYSAGADVIYAGNLYRAANAITNDTLIPSSDTTNWVNVSPATGAGYGWYFDGGVATESAWAACDAQQNAAGGIYLHNCAQINFQGSVSQVNTGLGIAGGTNLSSNPNYYSAVTIDNSKASIISMTTQAMQYAYVVRLINGATNNDIKMTGDGTAAATLSPDTVIVGTTTSLMYNGSQIYPIPIYSAGTTAISDTWAGTAGTIIGAGGYATSYSSSLLYQRLASGFYSGGGGTSPGWTLTGSGTITTSPLPTGNVLTNAKTKTILYNVAQPLASVSAPITISATGSTDIILVIASSLTADTQQWLPYPILGARLQLAGSTSTVSFVKAVGQFTSSWTTLTSSTAAQTFTAGSTYATAVSFNQLTGLLTLTIAGTSVLTFTLSSTDWTLFTTPANAVACGLSVYTPGDDGGTTIGTFTAVVSQVSDGYGAAAAALASSSSSGAPAMAIGSVVTSSGALTINQVTPVNAASGALTMTLPSGQAVGSRINAYKSDSSANTVTLSGSIRGSGTTTQALTLQYQGIELEADSNGYWWPINDQKTLSSLDARYIASNGVGVSAAPTASGQALVSTSTTAAGWSSIPTLSSANTFTANQTAPAFVASGLTGATAASRYVGATASGAPTTGTFAVGDHVVDQTGKIWICTTAGTPGTWTQVSSGGGSAADYAPTGLTGATAASRYVGATTGGAPTSGTFNIGDFCVDQTGAFWICTTAGTVGSGCVFTEVYPGTGLTNPMVTTGDTLYGGSTGTPARLPGNTSAQRMVLTQTGTGSASAAPVWAPQNYNGIFGDGSDGVVTFDGTTTHTGFSSLSGSTYTLSRHVFATSITVNSGVTIKTAGFWIFCTGTVSNAGTIQNVGNNGTAAGGAGGNLANQGSAGGAGSTTNGANGNDNIGYSWGGGASGAGGAGSGGTGGASAAASFTTPWALRTPYPLLANYYDGKYVAAGNGGGGGGGDGTNSGGGGGGGGGLVAMFAWTISNTGTISAQGGAGGTPTTGNAGGGGGGGGGLVLAYTLSAWSAGTTNVTGGSGGSGVGTGVAGNAGGSGTVLNVVIQ